MIVIVFALVALLFVPPAHGSALPPWPVLVIVAGLCLALACRVIGRRR